MIDHTAVIDTLRTQLKAVTGLPPEARRSWENVKFKPPTPDKNNPDSTTWIRETYLPGTEEWVANRVVEMNGVMEYSIFVPAGVSTEGADDLGLNIRNAFKPSTQLGGVLTVVRTDRLQGREEYAWYRVPVRISFRTQQNI